MADEVAPTSRRAGAWLLAVLLLAGCGGSSGKGDAEKAVTVPAYGGYPAITLPVTTGTRAQCRHEAQAFTRAAVSFLAPFPSDADNYVFLARLQFLAFKAHRCDVAILRNALVRRATAKQRRTIVSSPGFGFLGETGRELAAP